VGLQRLRTRAPDCTGGDASIGIITALKGIHRGCTDKSVRRSRTAAGHCACNASSVERRREV
jgi:hypothetical protein